MKRVLYVDFENVSSAGLNGVLKLTKNDEVKIFLGPKCSKMSLIEAESILHCDATVELIKNDQIGKNALDFIIMVHLGYDIAKREGDAFFIISNDKGYEPAIHEMQSKTGETIERYPDIEHVIARKDEAPGLFARLFGKKKPVVENTTEHEVLKKGNRTSGGRNGGARSGSGSHSGNGAGSRGGSSAGGRNSNGRSADGRNGAGSRGGNGAGRNANGRDVNGRNANAHSVNGQGANNRNANGQNAGGRNPVGRNVSDNVSRQNNSDENRQGSGLNAVKAVTQEKSRPTIPETKPAAVSEQKPAVTPVQKQPVAPEKKQPVKSEKKPNPTVKPAEQANKPSASVGSKPKAIVRASTKPGSPITITTQDDSYLDNLSIADLRAQLSDGTSPAPQSVPASKSVLTDATLASADISASAKSLSGPKKPATKAKLEMSDAERALVERALAETDNLGDFHNYILKELHDNDRATEIYKAEKYKVGKK